MKKIIFTLVVLLYCGVVSAQKIKPQIKAGTILNAFIFVQDNEVSAVISIKSASNPFILNWSVNGYGDGSFEISDKAIENGRAIYMEQPSPGLTKLDESQTYGIISRAAFKSLINSKSFTYNNIKFEAKTENLKPIYIGEKELDAIQVVGANGKIQLWILNNQDFPMILQSVGLPIDMLVTGIKE